MKPQFSIVSHKSLFRSPFFSLDKSAKPKLAVDKILGSDLKNVLTKEAHDQDDDPSAQFFNHTENSTLEMQSNILNQPVFVGSKLSHQESLLRSPSQNQGSARAFDKFVRKPTVEEKEQYKMPEVTL